MTDRYGTFQQTTTYPFAPGSSQGVIDMIDGDEYHTPNMETAKRLAKLLNQGQDCRFNCRARREADYLQGWVDRDRDCPITESGKRCAKRYLDGAPSGLGMMALKSPQRNLEDETPKSNN